MKSTPNKQQIYISNLGSEIKEDDLKSLFESHGTVYDVKIILDHNQNSRGFGFIEMDTSAALDAILALNKRNFCGNILEVNAITDQEFPVTE